MRTILSCHRPKTVDCLGPIFNDTPPTCTFFPISSVLLPPTFSLPLSTCLAHRHAASHQSAARATRLSSIFGLTAHTLSLQLPSSPIPFLQETSFHNLLAHTSIISPPGHSGSSALSPLPANTLSLFATTSSGSDDQRCSTVGAHKGGSRCIQVQGELQGVCSGREGGRGGKGRRGSKIASPASWSWGVYG